MLQLLHCCLDSETHRDLEYSIGRFLDDGDEKAAAASEAEIIEKVGARLKRNADGEPGLRERKRAKNHHWYMSKAQRNLVELDNALRGPDGKGVSLQDVQLDETCREKGHDPLGWKHSWCLPTRGATSGRCSTGAIQNMDDSLAGEHQLRKFMDSTMMSSEAPSR